MPKSDLRVEKVNGMVQQTYHVIHLANMLGHDKLHTSVHERHILAF